MYAFIIDISKYPILHHNVSDLTQDHVSILGHPETRIAEGRLTAVLYYQGRFYAAKPETYSIHVYENTNQWKECNSFSITAEPYHFITMCISSDLLYVCSSDDDKIDASTLNGVFQFSAGKPGSGAPGELLLPYICATDTSGETLIADCGNNRFQVLSASGQWSILNLEPPIRSPMRACLVNGTIYVSDRNNDLLSVYKAI